MQVVLHTSKDQCTNTDRCHGVPLVPSGLLHAKRNSNLTVTECTQKKSVYNKKDITLVKRKIDKGVWELETLVCYTSIGTAFETE